MTDRREFEMTQVDRPSSKRKRTSRDRGSERGKGNAMIHQPPRAFRDAKPVRQWPPSPAYALPPLALMIVGALMWFDASWLMWAAVAYASLLAGVWAFFRGMEPNS